MVIFVASTRVSGQLRPWFCYQLSWRKLCFALEVNTPLLQGIVEYNGPLWWCFAGSPRRLWPPWEDLLRTLSERLTDQALGSFSLFVNFSRSDINRIWEKSVHIGKKKILVSARIFSGHQTDTAWPWTAFVVTPTYYVDYSTLVGAKPVRILSPRAFGVPDPSPLSEVNCKGQQRHTHLGTDYKSNWTAEKSIEIKAGWLC